MLPDGLSVDVALKPLKWRVAVEFDGPRHYFKNDKRAATGRTRFKQRLLRALGWRVLHVPYFDWAALPDDDAKRDYLRTQLGAIVRAARARQSAPAPDEPPQTKDDRDEFSSLKVAELRKLCDDRGLDKTVKRDLGDARTVLSARLRAHRDGGGGASARAGG